MRCRELLFAALAAAALIGAARPAKRPNPDSAVIAEAKSAVEARLRDPMSVQYRDVHVAQKGMLGKPTVCGEKNAKNSYGGYNGFEKFAYPTAIHEAHFNSEAESMWDAYAEGCWQEGRR